MCAILCVVVVVSWSTYTPSSLSIGVHTSIRRCMHGGHEVNSYNYCTLRLRLSHLHTIVTSFPVIRGILLKHVNIIINIHNS